MGTTLACILYLGHIKLIEYYIFATRTVVRSRATGWVFNQPHRHTASHENEELDWFALGVPQPIKN